MSIQSDFMVADFAWSTMRLTTHDLYTPFEVGRL